MKKNKPQSLSYRLYYTFIISFIIPILLICLLISYLFSNYQHKNIQDEAASTTELISAYLDKYIRDIDYIMRAPYYHSYFQSKTKPEEMTPAYLNKLNSEIGDTLMLTTYSRDDFGDLLILSNQKVIYFNSQNYYQYLPSEDPLTSRNWYTAALEKEGRIAIVPADTDSVSKTDPSSMNFFISRKLNNLFDPAQENVIAINMKSSTLASLFSELSLNTPNMILFTNDAGELIYSNREVDTRFLNSLDQDKILYEKNTWVHNSQKLEKYPLTIHVLLSTSYITRQIGHFILVSLLCCLIGLVIAYLFFRRNKTWISDPVLEITSVLKNLEEGNLNSRCPPLRIREFNEIGHSIGLMANQLQERIKNEYELTLAQKELQFQALQSQIQPHFIINTIYSFISLNQIGETELLNDAFYSFARLLRYVLNKNKTSTLGEELDFLNDYCSLHQLRFGPRITYHISCPENLRRLEIPRLLMQPLVENAVVHGIEPCEFPCTLTIHAEEHDDTIYLFIEDDGVGFTREQICSSNSIGIKNVTNRIHIWNNQVELLIFRVENHSIQIFTIPELPRQGDDKT